MIHYISSHKLTLNRPMPMEVQFNTFPFSCVIYDIFKAKNMITCFFTVVSSYTWHRCSVKKAKTNHTFFRRSALVRFYGEHELLVPKLVIERIHQQYIVVWVREHVIFLHQPCTVL